MAIVSSRSDQSWLIGRSTLLTEQAVLSMADHVCKVERNDHVYVMGVYPHLRNLFDRNFRSASSTAECELCAGIIDTATNVEFGEREVAIVAW